MSLLRPALNLWLRTFEKRRMRTGTTATLRRALEMQARLFFHPPRGTKEQWRSHGGVPCLTLTPRSTLPGRVLFYVHGGGFVFGSPDTHSAMAANLAQRIGATAILPRYRRAPEAPFPAAPRDVRAAWDGMLADGINPAQVVLGGDSAGGALVFGLVASLCAERRALPGAVFAFSPLTDLTYSGDSFAANAEDDVLLVAERAAELAELYLQGEAAENPAVSPLFSDFQGAPPVWMTVGDTEILLDDSRRMVARLSRYGVPAELTIARDLPHVWPLMHNILPEARQTLAALSRWIRQRQNWEV